MKFLEAHSIVRNINTSTVETNPVWGMYILYVNLSHYVGITNTHDNERTVYKSNMFLKCTESMLCIMRFGTVPKNYKSHVQG